MWTKNNNPDSFEMELSGQVEGVKASNILFSELRGRGAGIQYRFQGLFDLGNGESLYNLGLYFLSSEHILSWTVRKADGQGPLSKGERDRGRELAIKLSHTLPQIGNLGARHTTQWLQQAWESPKALSYDEMREEFIRELQRPNASKER
ncbi:hypothetical protein M1615_02805 [Patescibacteria group bacterium]|nr:hypothetical protein [Patescibacteria group bacterium]